MISHTARLISISVAHSLLQLKSANGGLQCLCSAAYTWHQISPLGTHHSLQETSTHPLQNRPHSTVVFPGLCRGILCHILSLEHKDMLLLLWPTQWLQVVISSKQEPPLLLLHWRTQQQTAPSSTAHISGHSELHIFTLLTLSPQLIDNRASENSSYTADRFNTGQMWWTTHTTSFKGQDSLTTREILVFFLHRWDFQFPDEEMKWCDIKQLMNLFN